MTTRLQQTPARLAGLDLARYLALIGMVIVNFDVVMVGSETSGPMRFAELLQGRAAAIFVVLAGLGFGLAAGRTAWTATMRTTLKRVAFLFLLGMINMLIFPADIIHYYAFYFLFGLLFLGISNDQIFAAIIVLTACFPLALLFFDYEAGWNWETVSYSGLWTVRGFLRNLFLNGWHPIIPWMVFFLVGILLSRITLGSRKVQSVLLLAGVAVFAMTLFLAGLLTEAASALDPELHYFFTTAPIPPMPLFVAAGCSIACAVIGLCLIAEPWLKSWRLLELITPAGRQTLTIYIAHIVIGMGLLEGLNMIGGQSPKQALGAAFVFCAVATVFAFLWSLVFKRGPLETAMRRIAG
jgi:uncharacterized membrane protein YeiB